LPRPGEVALGDADDERGERRAGIERERTVAADRRRDERTGADRQRVVLGHLRRVNVDALAGGGGRERERADERHEPRRERGERAMHAP
jgi:hypothetical protein